MMFPVRPWTAATLALGLLLVPCGAATPAENPPDYQREPLVPPDMKDIADQAAGLFRARAYGEAAKAYLFIIERHPKSLHAWSNLGVTWFIDQKYDKACEAFETAIELAPDYVIAHEMLSITQYQLRDFPAAEQAARKALAVDADSVGAMRSLAMALAAQNQIAQARQVLADALAIEPDNPDLIKLKHILDSHSPAPKP